ncbi:NAD(P)-binding protein [Salix suchowensis]|nr:NAD(P)-binding protein [Salix suchowensis]
MADNILHELNARNLFDLHGLVAVVTGGGTVGSSDSLFRLLALGLLLTRRVGNGMMISSTLAANGATVYIIGPNQHDLDKVTDSYNTACDNHPGRGKMHGLQGDIRLKSEATRLSVEIGKREPYVTTLFNNAGVGGQGSFVRPTEPTASAFVANLFDAVDPNSFDNTIRTNAVGPYWMSLAFLPLLEKWKHADIPAARKFVPQIVMTSSMNGWSKDSATAAFSFPYLFSKSAIGHFTSSLAHELLPLGVRVNGIAPGLFPTEVRTNHSLTLILLTGARQMVSRGKADDLGISYIPPGTPWPLEIPAGSLGSRVDMGTLFYSS